MNQIYFNHLIKSILLKHIFHIIILLLLLLKVQKNKFNFLKNYEQEK